MWGSLNVSKFNHAQLLTTQDPLPSLKFSVFNISHYHSDKEKCCLHSNPSQTHNCVNTLPAMVLHVLLYGLESTLNPIICCTLVLVGQYVHCTLVLVGQYVHCTNECGWLSYSTMVQYVLYHHMFNVGCILVCSWCSLNTIPCIS